ncbi:calmodulin-like 3 [Cichlidogyrus casuarinus]|uniref:Calmodulin-like 3 n=1 Tax=Cichlidogyrus casuarinus TaxID=1844966 RepID=A0ABD2Q051_9PLAT
MEKEQCPRDDDPAASNDNEIMFQHDLDEQKIRELREMFNCFDSDGDGAISSQELSNIIKTVSNSATDSQIKLLMNKADIDGDGTIEFKEFVDLLVEFNATGQMKDSTIACFKIFDTDNDGYITVEELGRVLDNIGQKYSGNLSHSPAHFAR